MTVEKPFITDFSEVTQELQRKGEGFAVATVIKTSGSTAAKAGAKAVLDKNGEIIQGWIGGGCVTHAMKEAVARAKAEGVAQLICLHPPDVLAEKGISAGDVIDGVRFAKNGCSSKGSLDIFVELMLPPPEICIYGLSPVARALAKLAVNFDWSVVEAEASEELEACTPERLRMIVVATQGKDDLGSLRAALTQGGEFVAFVGSRRKFVTLADKLAKEGVSQKALARVQAPAGLCIGAVTPDEIALSILAQLTQIRRQGQRKGEKANG